MSSGSIEHTATSPAGSGSEPAGSESGIAAGTMIDHYVIEKELGSGGMGVVYAVFDTELQRRVALKVLRDGLTDQAQQRLLREARAMARLAHTHVVTVYEVGSANGRDFVAMELVDGESLAEWLRAKQRSEHEILDAFVAAGRGLAAAHAAGMVHRDFKPHNVLRSRGGRVVVTDFGLAREATDPLAVTQPVVSSSVAATDSAPSNSALSDLTVPGAIVGTPAYMAPEQWSGGRITPATDQFAFCVALWEAFTGERPYRGPTLDELREQVSAGPSTLDASKVPRRLRAVLRRGLATDPAARFPSMDALLARLGRRSMRIAIAVIALAAIAATVTVVALGRSPRTAAKSTCRDPIVVVPTVRETIGWHSARSLACELPVTVREVALTCLDRIAARFDALSRARTLSGAYPIEPFDPEPMTCTLGRPFAGPLHYSDEAVAALAIASGGVVPPDRVDAARVAAATQPCVAAYLALSDARLDDAEPAIEACNDDLARAELALRRFERDARGLADTDLAKRERELERTMDIVAGQAFNWRIDAATAAAARDRNHIDEALVAYDAAINRAPDERRGAQLVVSKLETLLERGRRLDVELTREQVAKWKPIADRAKLEMISEKLDWLDATAQWLIGDIVGGGDRVRALHAKRPTAMPGGTRITGRVLDANGLPAAGATVASGFAVVGDGHNIMTPLHESTGAMRMVNTAMTDADGRFVLEDAPGCFGAIVAQKGSARSNAVASHDGATLLLQPTTHVRGHVDLSGRVGMFAVSASRADRTFIGTAQTMAMVGADGRFSIEGIVPGDIVLSISEGTRSLNNHGMMKRVRVGPRGLEDVVLEVPAGRTLRVLLRGDDTMAATPIFVVDGTFETSSMNELLRRAGQHQMASAPPRAVVGPPPAEFVGQYKPGDFIATMPSVPTGPVTACALRRFKDCRDDMPLHCVAVPANAALVTLEANKP